MARLLGLGDNTVDTYVDHGLQFPGGNAVNVAVLSRRLGAEASYLGCFGADEAGDLLEAALLAEGVSLERCRRAPGANARALIGHDGGDRRFIGSSPGTRAAYRLAPQDFTFIAAHDLTHTSANSDLDPMLPAIKAAAALLSYDFSEKWTDARLDAVLPHLDIAFLSDPRGSDESSEELARRCAMRGPGTVVVTRGAAGALAMIGGRAYRQDVAPTEVVDTLGAGDGFIAGFLVARLTGAEPQEALGAGARNAARVCTYRGAFGHEAAWHAGSSMRQAG